MRHTYYLLTSLGKCSAIICRYCVCLKNSVPNQWMWKKLGSSRVVVWSCLSFLCHPSVNENHTWVGKENSPSMSICIGLRSKSFRFFGNSHWEIAWSKVLGGFFSLFWWLNITDFNSPRRKKFLAQVCL